MIAKMGASDPELARAKEFWLEGWNDREVGLKMGWSPSKACLIRTWVLRLPPTRHGQGPWKKRPPIHRLVL
jgi:hypothetical protein